MTQMPGSRGRGDVPNSIRPGDVIADRYRMVDLLRETSGGLFWRAHDQVLARHVAFHVIRATDPRAPLLLDAAKRSATVVDARILRVLDADERNDLCYVVNEWGSGQSLDLLLAEGPLSARRAAWIVSEVAETIAKAHDQDQAHGRLVPENVLIDHNGTVKIIGFAVDAALHGLPPGRVTTDTVDLAGILYAALVGKWPGVSRSGLPTAPQSGGQPLRPRKVRAGIPKALDAICDDVLSPFAHTSGTHTRTIATAADIHDALVAFVGDPGALAAAEADQAPLLSWPTRDPDATQRMAPVDRVEPETVAEPTSEPDPLPDPQPDPQPASDHEATVVAVPLPDDTADIPLEEPDPQETVAGAPAFETDWLTPRKDNPPPPPSFEQPPERPLYAPDPVRRPRPSATGSGGNGGDRGNGGNGGNGGDQYWPWDSGSGSGPIVAPEPEDEPEGRVPGRSWLLLAAVVATGVIVLAIVAFAVAFDFGGNGGNGSNDPTGNSSSPSGQGSDRAGARIKVSGADDYDPQADPPEENPDDVANVIDGDRATFWSTSTYDQNFGPGGLKDGVGVLLDLGKDRGVGEVGIDFGGTPTEFSLYLSNEPPHGVPTGEPAAEEIADRNNVTVSMPEDSSGRYLLVWLTSLPEQGGFTGEIREITVRS
jgi:serine/threonine kinase PknH